MPSMEERMSSVERTLRLHHRDRTTMRAIYDMAIQDIHVRFDELEKRMGAVDSKMATKDDLEQLETRLDSRIDAVQDDVKAILTIIKKKFPD